MSVRVMMALLLLVLTLVESGMAQGSEGVEDARFVRALAEVGYFDIAYDALNRALRSSPDLLGREHLAAANCVLRICEARATADRRIRRTRLEAAEAACRDHMASYPRGTALRFPTLTLVEVSQEVVGPREQLESEAELAAWSSVKVKLFRELPKTIQAIKEIAAPSEDDQIELRSLRFQQGRVLAELAIECANAASNKAKSEKIHEVARYYEAEAEGVLKDFVIDNPDDPLAIEAERLRASVMLLTPERRSEAIDLLEDAGQTVIALMSAASAREDRALRAISVLFFGYRVRLFLQNKDPAHALELLARLETESPALFRSGELHVLAAAAAEDLKRDLQVLSSLAKAAGARGSWGELSRKHLRSRIPDPRAARERDGDVVDALALGAFSEGTPQGYTAATYLINVLLDPERSTRTAKKSPRAALMYCRGICNWSLGERNAAADDFEEALRDADVSRSVNEIRGVIARALLSAREAMRAEKPDDPDRRAAYETACRLVRGVASAPSSRKSK